MGKSRNFKHGLSQTRIYSIWDGMKKRCKNPKRHEYWNGRGITVCEEWQTFMPFYEWSMKNGYQQWLTIDRVDNDGNYEPGNCRWTTYSVQNSNRRKFQKMPRR
jgi:hypothetical protein